MRGQNHPGLKLARRVPGQWLPRLATGTAAAIILTSGLQALAQMLPEAPGLTGPSPPTSAASAPPVPRMVTDDVRPTRSYPEQPPIIPHSVEGYQLTLNTNRCLTCHARQYSEGSGAPMISITHFVDRDGNVLADVAPRRYFCMQCHVPQADVQPLVPNAFQDALSLSAPQRR